MNKTLRNIANTIVANLANTEPAGLFDGKMGICLFLYKYSRYSGFEIYDEIASNLLDEIFDQLTPGMSSSAMDGLAGIGFGLVELLKDGFLESDPDDNILKNMDDILLRGVRNTLMREAPFSITLYSSGIYLLSRMSFRRNEMESEWIVDVIGQAIWLIEDFKKRTQKVPELSLLNSMLYVFARLFAILETDKNKIQCILMDILHFSSLSIQQHNYNEIDILLFRQNVEYLSEVLDIEKFPIIGVLREMTNYSEEVNMDMLYNNMWWWLLYDLYPIENISSELIENYVDKKLRASYYDELAVNSKLAALGCWIMSRNGCK
ncbi:lanthionine synthetase LanC family protein [Bacteroides faecalis]|uniref:Lanthionine synthetase n=1 Tax=Bacteroides faecalis TaxID=2447885 RepID=A0A401LQY9_9BACE|nr:lanthionine synthetase LanC family protein [Bacteroides faecalis]GCB33883.1 hypothetical protein KGMB02408_08280 [Bacteroides faecalis]